MCAAEFCKPERTGPEHARLLMVSVRSAVIALVALIPSPVR